MTVWRWRRWVWMAALSLALHVAVLIWLGRPRPPNLFANGPDLSSMTVELMRPTSVSRPSRARPAERSTVRTATAPAPRAVKPLVPPVASTPERVASVPAPPATGPAPGDLQAALRSGAGCTRGMVRSREERAACEERLGRLGGSGRGYGAPIDPGKRAYYDELAAAGPSGRSYGDPVPAAVTPDGAAYFRGVNCSIKFGRGSREKDRQGMIRLGRTPCYVPLQGSVFTPEASAHKR